MPDTPDTRWWALTVWTPGAIPPEEWEYRNLVRVWLPFYDLVLIISGVGGTIYGIPAVDLLFPPAFQVTITVLFTLTAAVALVGVWFPRLSLIERWAKVALIGLLVAYFGALSLLALFVSPESRAFVAGIALAACVPAAARLSILRAQQQKRAAVAAIKEAKRAETERG
jgi:hypothetical protein